MENYVAPIEPKQILTPSSQETYYGPVPDYNAQYAAELARSNQQFRDNMNRQAQDWNNYVNQKRNQSWWWSN